MKSQARILVVDSDKIVLGAVSQWLKAMGHQIMVAALYQKAIDLLDNEQFNLVLLDISSPRVNGLKLIQKVHGLEIAPPIPVVAMTSVKSRELKKKALAWGCRGFLIKPFTRRHLIDTIRGVLKADTASARMKVYTSPHRSAPVDAVERPKRAARLSPQAREDGKPRRSSQPAAPPPEKAHAIAVDESLPQKGAAVDRCESEDQRVTHLVETILEKAVEHGASAIHVEPGEREVAVEIRFAGKIRRLYELEREFGDTLIECLKKKAFLRAPQERAGSFISRIRGRRFRVIVSTSPTRHGETVVLRLKESHKTPLPLRDLGMSRDQQETVKRLMNRRDGLIIIAGPEGSGKHTTAASLLSEIVPRSRRLFSVESLAKYKISGVEQKETDYAGGIDTEALLRSVLRQEPDVLFISEIRNLSCVHRILEFVSSGHLCIVTLHVTNTSSLIPRLLSLGFSRNDLAETVRVVIFQCLLQLPCPHCKKRLPPSPEDRASFEGLGLELPEEVVVAGGCEECASTGVGGKKAVFEVQRWDACMANAVRMGSSRADVLRLWQLRGVSSLVDQAVQKIHDGLVTVVEVYEEILVNEEDAQLEWMALGKERGETLQAAPAPGEPTSMPVDEQASDSVTRAAAAPPPSRAQREPGSDSRRGLTDQPSDTARANSRILLVDDDADFCAFCSSILQLSGYETTTASDGLDALFLLASHEYELVISDLQMPNLGGIQLLEIARQKGINAPIVFTTGSTDPSAELRCLKLGAVDFVRKPLDKDVFLMRVELALSRARS